MSSPSRILVTGALLALWTMFGGPTASAQTYTIEEVNVNGDELQWRFSYPENSHLAHIFAELGSTETLAGVEG